MITGTLQYGTTTVNLPEFEVALEEETLEQAVDVVTLDFNMYTDFRTTKREWKLNWDSLTEAQYNDIKAAYNNQFINYQYPVFAVGHYGFSVPCRMSINTKEVWNHCGDVQDVEITLRETIQLPTPLG